MRAKKVKNFCGAVDVGGTKIGSALFTSEGRMLGKSKVLIDKSGGEKSAQQILKIIEKLEELARSEGAQMLAVGIDIPGVVFAESGRVWAPNIPGWDNFPLRDRLKEKTTLPLVLDSDRSAYVLGEQWCGIARNMKNVVFLAVGTGIGAGMILDGKLYRGSEDIAGAVGWFALNPDYKKEYGEMGCFEAEASGSSVGRRAIELLRAEEASMIKDMAAGKIENITAETVIEAARKGDSLAKKILQDAVNYLAMGIANIISFLNPEVIVLGGGLFQAGEIVLGPVREESKKWAQPLAAKKVRIELSQLGEDAGLYGAGKLAWDYR